MKVKIAKTAGFCMGVHRAMEMVLAEANRGKGPIYTYGPLIHNKQVLELLESKGIKTVESLEGLKEGTLLIRAHGIPPEERKFLKSSGMKIMDATCPRVARVQAIIRYHTKKGYTPVIAGDNDHPEVIGLVGYGMGQAQVINDASEVSSLPDAEKVILVAQTTQDTQNYQHIKEAIQKRFSEALIFDTICDATYSRQDEVRSFAGDVDGLVVVGGYHSGNTQRLVQISRAAGMPTFHVETEEELNREQLSAMDVVAVTAGASTPNWMIKNVVQEIGSIKSRGETPVRRWIKNLVTFLMVSNLAVALGAFSLAYAATILAGREPDLVHPCLAFLYIYTMHVVNRFLDEGASTYNDPEMADFYRRYRFFLIITSITSMIGAFVLSYYLGIALFFAIAVLSILGIVYSIPIVPARLRHLWRYSKIKDIPGSKTLSMAMAWGVVIAILPLLEDHPPDMMAAITSFLFVFSMAYVRSALFDIFQAQGDLIVGAESLPITLGEKRTMILLKWIIIFSALIIFISPIFGLVGPFSLLLLACSIYLAFCLLTYEKRWLNPGSRLEAIIEGNFFLAGLLGLFWQLMS